MRILLVEDHPDSAAVLARLLRANGYVVHIAEDAESAIAAAAGAEAFDAVLCDLTLPDGDGRDVMRSLHTGHGLRGIALTGQDVSMVDTSDGTGFVGHLLKPIDLNALLEAMRLLT
jgi:two-component system CheB/CheR fusion protein